MARKAASSPSPVTFLNLGKDCCWDVPALNEVVLQVTHYQVLTCPKACSVQVYSPSSSSNPSFPVASSFIRYILLTAMKKKPAPHTSNSTQQSNSEACGSVGVHVVPATGLLWFLYHIGLVFSISLYSITLFFSCHKKSFLCKAKRKYLPLPFSTFLHPVSC